MGATISRERTRCASMLTSPQTPGKPFRAFVDPALALDEITQRFIQVLVFCGVPQHPRPLAPRPTIDLVWIGRAKDQSGKRFGLPDRIVPSQVQRPMSTLDCLALLRPRHDDFENGGQILIDRIPITAGLNRFPFILQSQQSSLATLRLKKGWWLVHGRAWSQILKIVHGIEFKINGRPVASLLIPGPYALGS